MENLKAALEEAGLTQSQLAEATGLSAKTVWNAVQGKRANRATRNLIASALNKSVESLFSFQYEIATGTTSQEEKGSAA